MPARLRRGRPPTRLRASYGVQTDPKYAGSGGMGALQEFRYEPVDFLRHADLAEGSADALTGADEVLPFAQGDGCGDTLRPLGRGRESPMEAILGVEGGDGEGEHHLVEVSCAPLSAALQMLDASSSGFAVKDR